MRRLVLFILVVSLALSMVSVSGLAEEKTLTVWLEKSFSDDANAFMQARIEGFGTRTGVKVTCELIAATDFVTKLNAAIEANKDIPDVVSADTTKTLNYYPNIPYMDVSGLVNEINADRPYFEASYSGTKIGDVHYYVPFYSSSTLMYVRKDVLEAKGITQIPTTWEEVVDTARKVTDPASDFYGLGMGCGENDDDDENTWRQWMWNEDAYLFNEQGEVTANSGKVAEMLNLYKTLYEEKVLPPDSVTWNAGGNNGSYLAGRTAIVFNAPTLYNALRNNPENAELFSNTVVMAPPIGTKNGVYMGFARGFAIMNASKNVESAKNLIRYLVDKEWYDEYFTYSAPVFAPLFVDEVENPLWKDDAVNAEALTYAQNAKGYYGYPVDNIEGRAVASKHYFNFPVVKMVNQVITGSETAEEAISQTIRLIEDLQDQVR